jgi:hypothetical protein
VIEHVKAGTLDPSLGAYIIANTPGADVSKLVALATASHGKPVPTGAQPLQTLMPRGQGVALSHKSQMSHLPPPGHLSPPDAAAVKRAMVTDRTRMNSDMQQLLMGSGLLNGLDGAAHSSGGDASSSRAAAAAAATGTPRSSGLPAPQDTYPRVHLDIAKQLWQVRVARTSGPYLGPPHVCMHVWTPAMHG